MKIYYLNHQLGSTDWSTTDNAVVQCLQQLGFDVTVRKPDEDIDITGKSHLLIHHPNIQEKFYAKEELQQCIDNNAIIFFMSSVGVFFQPFCHSYACGMNREKRTGYVFGIKKNGQHVTEDEWKSLFEWAKKISGTPEDIDKIIDGMSLKVKTQLCPVQPEYLKSLLMLCQGFIAAHEGRTDNSSYLDGWDKLQSKLKKAAESKITITEKPTWWGSVLGAEYECKGISDELTKLGQNEIEWIKKLSRDAKKGNISLETVQEVFKKCRSVLENM